jgi:hypothetical protein
MTKARTNQLGMTEDDNFIVKAAMQLGFEFVDGDTSTMQVSTRNLIAFVSDRSRRAHWYFFRHAGDDRFAVLRIVAAARRAFPRTIFRILCVPFFYFYPGSFSFPVE